MAVNPKTNCRLAIDVGNTSTGIYILQNKEIIAQRTILSDRHQPDLYQQQFAAILSEFHPRRAIISSVVPPLEPLIQQLLKAFSINYHFISINDRKQLFLKIDQPDQLGMDRMAAALGALTIFPPPLIVIDSGTALTFELISEKCEYLGGVILPGFALQLKSLALFTAKLPLLEPARFDGNYGKNTEDSILAGVYGSIVASCEHFIKIYKKILGRRSKVIATGGNINLFADRLKTIDLVEPDLILKGLLYIEENLSENGRPD